jgi:hypothetical protein
VPVHPLQGCDNNTILGHGDGQGVSTEVFVDSSRQKAIGEILLFSSLSQAAHVYLNQLSQAWNAKIVLTSKSISPALRLSLCGEIILKGAAHRLVRCADEKIEVAPRIRPVVECFHDHDGMATALKLVDDGLQKGGGGPRPLPFLGKGQVYCF